MADVREEQLREAACVGDVVALNNLLLHDVDINSKNAINGWTALHWGCKRGRLEAVRLLVEAGADVTATNSSDQLPSDLTSNTHILQLLGVEVPEEEVQEPAVAAATTFTPAYIAHPTMRVDLSPSRLPNGDGGSPTEPLTAPPNGLAEKVSQAADTAAGPAAPTAPCTVAGPPTSTCVCHCHRGSGKGVLADDGASMIYRRTSGKAVLADDELVLKVRVAGLPDDTDFIEMELPTAQLTYHSLLRHCCRELDIDGKVIERVRKLPNTIIRRDRDVQRLTDYQELELVLRGSAASGRQSSAAHQAGPFSRPIVY